MFSEDFAKLTGSEQNRFAEICNKILLKGFLVREAYDSREKILRTNPDYNFVDKYFDIFEGYLKFSGWTLKRDDMLGVFALFNNYEENRIRLDRETSVVLVALRKIYDTEMEEGQVSGHGDHSVFLTTATLVNTMNNHGLIMPGKRLNGRLVCRCLRFLANHNVIAKVSGSYDEGNVSFFILPSIVYALDNEKIVAMSNALNELKEKENNEEGGLF